ncbi:hypothetical protein EMIHUDRAFT_221600 [Emiliania huxleyi CCMP1516]|uniref:Uncharacterized protein n=4 Tax=Emiliania huxleyi TaxID=2903 RepID=A0A0D3HYQ2_EMIH1|nr:hypothetical protein EMIHUDRAFT_221600 [Emiliania huxleyi CCMP1516]EOD04137.1 hypothetical protein EMIHUDRAFT_221600 [Emiliania huxleyi CCMP1516]|eukprot:XP_005756566.1 hypothetical protein EMIHUDRAFT_221600 [Emiliania huxleyi CCMP1516]
MRRIADMMRLLAVVALAAAAHSAPVEKTAAIDDVQAGLADAVSRLQDGLGPVCGSVEACVHGLANGTVAAADFFEEHLDGPARSALRGLGTVVAAALHKEEVDLERIVDAVYPALLSAEFQLTTHAQ